MSAQGTQLVAGARVPQLNCLVPARRGQHLAVRGKRHAHDVFGVLHHGMLIASFGLRRGSQKDKGHDHIPNDLHVSPGFAKALAQCTKSQEDWLQVMSQKGLVGPPLAFRPQIALLRVTEPRHWI